MKRFGFVLVAIGAVCAGTPLVADGVNNGLHDPPVVPIVRAPVAGTISQTTIGAPLTIGAAGASGKPPGCGAGRLAGYPTSIACDHVAVGLTTLGGLALLTVLMAAGSTN